MSVNRISQAQAAVTPGVEACPTCGGLGIVLLRGEAAGEMEPPALPCPECRLAYDHDGTLFIRPNSILLD